jgi:uncharacterized protein (TIGR03663 family)
LAALPNKRAWWILTVLAIVVGTGWRALHLETRPLHADEAVQAWQTWQLLDGEGYRYDPWDRHGPTLYFGSAWLHQLRGGSADDYDDRSARRYALAAGIATLVLVGFGARSAGFGAGTGAFAVTLLAFETLSSVYHTYFIQEASLAFLIWAFLFLALRENRSRPWLDLFLLGVLAGLAQATKATTPLYLGLAMGALWITRPKPVASWNFRKIGVACVGFAIPFTLFYSSFGSHPLGIVDGVRTYFLQTDRLHDSPHLYPWWHYLKTLGIIPTGGPPWGQYLLLLLSIVGGGLALKRDAKRAHRVVALFTLGVLIVQSLIPYKTPWLLLTPMIGLAMLAAISLVELTRLHRWAIGGAVLVAMATASQSLAKSQLALDRYPGDSRNPYFYVQAPRGLLTLPQRINQLQAASATPLNIAVISPEHAWPLPWYLRAHPQIGYFDQAPASLHDWDIVIWDNQLGDAPPTLSEFPVAEIHGLRPNVLLFTFIQSEPWERVFPPLSP